MAKINKSDHQWKQELGEDRFNVLRKKGTEAPGSGELLHNHDSGDYVCAACNAKLFASDTKFESETGWPSFYDALPGSVDFHEDKSLFTKRTEVTCANCGGHLGHVFEGEPYGNPTDKRFCINSLSLKFDPKKSE